MNFFEQKLPQKSDQQDLEQKSRDKLKTLFNEHNFIARDEHERDSGVDFSIELKLKNGSLSNVRFNIQLKATQKKSNKDKTYSFVLDTSNINYLLSSIKGMYVLYVTEENSFYYEWAEDIYKYFEKNNPKWQKQETNTYRFNKKLENSTLINIHNTVLTNAKFNIELRETLNKTTGLLKNIIIDSESNKINSDQNITEKIEKIGFSLINAGHSNKVIELAKSATYDIENNSTICIILASANYYTGNLASAWGYIKK